MAKGRKETTTTYTPWGSNEQKNLLKSANQQYKTVSGDFGNIYNQLKYFTGTMGDTTPEFQAQLDKTLQGQYQGGVSNLAEAYAPKYRANTQNVVARFGGLNSSVGRDTQAEIGRQEQKAYSDLANDIEGKRYTITQQELANQQTQLGNLMNMLNLTPQYGQYLEGVIKQSPSFAPVNQTTSSRTGLAKFYDPLSLFT